MAPPHYYHRWSIRLRQPRQPHQPPPLLLLLALALLLLLTTGPQPALASPSPPPPPPPSLGSAVAPAGDLCKPSVPPSDPLPPCVEIESIEALCYPNGTGPLFLEAHAQCMCHGSYFPEWTACRRCLFLHGQLSERDLAFYTSIASTASASLCGFLTPPQSAPGPPKPTAIFKDLFTSVEAVLASPATGAAAPSDQARGDTDVALYFTASGALGPGPITGSAAAATGSGGLVLATGRPSWAGGGHGGGGGSSSGPGLVGVTPPKSTAGAGAGAGASAAGGRAGRLGRIWLALGLVVAVVPGRWLGGLGV